jgi:hypothetical protein
MVKHYSEGDFSERVFFVKNILAIIVFVGIIGLLGIAFIPGIIDKNQSRNAAENVLDNVIEQDYEKAFESVYFYDRASDLEPTISYKDAKNKWIERVKELEEKGTYVVNYNQLRVRLNDTYPEGTVDLVIMENGEKKVKEDVRLWFGKNESGWKLGNLDYYKDDTEEDWEKALSGHFSNSINKKHQITSFQGTLYGVNDNGTIDVECSGAVYRDKTGRPPSYWVCSVKIKEETLIIGMNNQQLERKDLKNYEHNVEVILAKPKDINENVKSRNLVAKEIRIIDDEN